MGLQLLACKAKEVLLMDVYFDYIQLIHVGGFLCALVAVFASPVAYEKRLNEGDRSAISLNQKILQYPRRLFPSASLIAAAITKKPQSVSFDCCGHCNYQRHSEIRIKEEPTI